MDVSNLIQSMNGFELFDFEDAVGASLGHIQDASETKVMYALLWIVMKRDNRTMQFSEVKSFTLSEVSEKLNLDVPETDDEANLEA